MVGRQVAGSRTGGRYLRKLGYRVPPVGSGCCWGGGSTSCRPAAWPFDIKALDRLNRCGGRVELRKVSDQPWHLHTWGGSGESSLLRGR